MLFRLVSKISESVRKCVYVLSSLPLDQSSLQYVVGTKLVNTSRIIYISVWPSYKFCFSLVPSCFFVVVVIRRGYFPQMTVVLGNLQMNLCRDSR
jgi:hypothetical protein